MHDLQSLVSNISLYWQKQRAKTQMTLGSLMAVLETMPEGTQVINLTNCHSYRGYYIDLAFEKEEGTRLASELLIDCQEVRDRELEGYKGGWFLMGLRTPVWVARYGSLGERLISLGLDGSMETAPDELD
jgi:hypothetical protein